jgi:hypothetical protein
MNNIIGWNTSLILFGMVALIIGYIAFNSKEAK